MDRRLFLWSASKVLAAASTTSYFDIGQSWTLHDRLAAPLFDADDLVWDSPVGWETAAREFGCLPYGSLVTVPADSSFVRAMLLEEYSYAQKVKRLTDDAGEKLLRLIPEIYGDA